MLSANEKAILNADNPTNQSVDLGTELFDASNYALYFLTVEITADATGEKAVTVPFACEVLDVIVQSRATSGSGTVTLKAGANAITNAIAMADDNTMARAGTIDNAYSTLAAGATVTVDAHGAGDRGLITVVVKKV